LIFRNCTLDRSHQKSKELGEQMCGIFGNIESFLDLPKMCLESLHG
jgi:hypothetical protein